MKLEDLSWKFLREITDDFSKERIVGEGAFGVVYKGVTKNGDDVAVKKLKLRDVNLDYKQFQNEFCNLKKLKHQNIVQILGYCYEAEKKHLILPDGSKVHVDGETCAALCFEYLHNGSLQKHISDEFTELDWHKRFKIIKGTCEGLKYIHEKRIYHLDLKPDNILLDKDMVPKIADFGLSRIFGKKELSRITRNPYGTLGYQPPEHIDRGEISGKFDIFSLGVIMIKIVSGSNGYSKCLDMSLDEFIDQVQENWRNMLRASCTSNSLLEAYCHQVETCTLIALNCLDADSQKRPDIVKIIEHLNEVETKVAGKFVQKQTEILQQVPNKGRRKLFSGMTIHNNKKKMRIESKDITGLHQNINLMMGPSYSELEFVDARETSSDVVEKLIVGRIEEKEKLMTLFEGTSEKIVILPIHGIGGIGKTTFARMIYNDPKLKCYSHVWVHVSRRFGLNKICKSISSQLSAKKSLANERQMTQCCFTKLLSGKKILIVLDDLWEDNQFQLQSLKDMLYCKDSNIIILVTTRSECVAERICTNLQPYKILPLTNDMCWEIIKQRSGVEDRDDKEQLMGIGQEIAQKCGGVALAAISLGFTLRSMNFDQWVKVKDNGIWNEPVTKDFTLTNHVLASLNLSYSYMDPCLKRCFDYCGIFQKGQMLAKQDLIHQWISLGLIKPTKMLSTMQLSEKYIMQLLGLSFLQHSVSPTTSGAYHGHASFFTMHDLVHDLAVLVLGDDILYQCKQGNAGGSTCRYAVLSDCRKPLKLSTTSPAMLKALRFQDCFRTRLRNVAFSSAKSLRVLDLSECFIQKLPDSIGRLKQLGYLKAHRIQDQMVPSCITKLSKLNYLSLSESSELLVLPESIGDIVGLLHLDLSCCSGIEQLPESLGNLERLVHLDLSECSSLTGVPESLGSLTKLQYLNLSGIRWLAKLPTSFGNLCSLVHLNLAECVHLIGVPGSLSGFTKLQYLNLSCCSRLGKNRHESLRGLQDVVEILTELRYLNLEHCLESMYGDQPADERISFLCNKSNLEYLNISHNKNLYSIPETVAKLGKLRTLDLSFCRNLQRLPATISEIDSLKFLEISNCSKLDKSTVPQSINSSILLPHFLVHAGDGESTSTVVHLEYENPTKLYISMLENVMSAEEAQRIKLAEKSRIEELGLLWTRDAKRFVDDKEVLRELVPPDSVEIFKLEGYNSVSFPSWMANVATYLPYLVIIYIWELPNCKNLPPLGQLPNLEKLSIVGVDQLTKIDAEFYGGMRPFRRLDDITLVGLECLEEWNTTYSCGEDGLIELVLPNLLSLNIHFCPKLSFQPRLPGGNYKLSISGCDELILSSWGDIGHVRASSYAAATELNVENCFEPLHHWSLLRHLPGLTGLSIKHCYDLTCDSPDFLRGLSSLQRLSVKNCKYITSLPEMLGNLITLTEFEIVNCKRINSLPESIQQLTCLQRLQIASCPKLVQWCQLEENEKKLGYIKDKEIGDHLLGFDQESESDLYSDDQESESDLDSE
ncbi:unnamed protein product [Urochloa decumbens]|uniref:Protein kinase domain-containing protein n=1 Tax=Urochloa decumbens TaxID=240449 RepID=A0ABC9B685_9POAL